MKKIICAILLVILCLSGIGIGVAEEQMELTLYYGTMREMMEPVITAFMEKYPNIKVNEFRATTEELAATMQMELMAGNPQFDVTIIGDTTIEQIMEQYPDAFTEFTPQEESAIMPGLLDEDGIVLPVGMGFYTIAYNTDLVSESDAPTCWEDLLDEKWNNLMIMADPQSSSAVYGFIWYIVAYEGLGWEYFDKLDALNINYQGSHGTIAEMLNIGERAVAVLPMANVIKCINEGNPVSYNVPTDGSPTELTAAVLTKDSPNQEAAELFLNFLISVEGQELVTEHLGYIPVRSDMDFTLPDGTTLEGLDLHSRDVAWINEHREEIIDYFSALYAN